MTESTLNQQKKALREYCAEKRAQLSPNEIAAANEKLLRSVLSFPPFLAARSLFVYISLPREPDTHGIVEYAWAVGKQVYAPVCRGNGRMEAARITAWQDLSPGTHGIPEPLGRPTAPIGTRFDLSLIPCVCASLRGERLGHGAGYYDRFLENTPTLRLCLCYDKMIAETVPTGLMDVKMDYVATESGVFSCVDKL